jgi:hypothetical protein
MDEDALLRPPRSANMKGSTFQSTNGANGSALGTISTEAEDMDEGE